MKKLASVLAAATLALTPVTALAAEDYVPSVGNNGAPTVETVTDVENPVVAEKLNSGEYAVESKDLSSPDLNPEVKEKLEAAKKDIVEKGLTVFSDLDKAAAEKELDPAKLEVLKLFDISLMDLANDAVVDETGRITLTIAKPAELGNSGYLLYHNVETDTWVNVPYTEENGKIKFTVDSLSPFAIVAETKEAAEPEKPVNPENPTTPEKPETPTTPEKPTEPEKPATPEKPAEKPSTNNAGAGTATKPSTNNASGTTAPTTNGSVNTATNNNAVYFGTAAVLALAGVVLVVKARKNLAK